MLMTLISFSRAYWCFETQLLIETKNVCAECFNQWLEFDQTERSNHILVTLTLFLGKGSNLKERN